MTDRAHKEGIIHAYVDGFERGDHTAIADLFADDATVEDPVGALTIQGRAAIAEFYRASMATGARLVLDGPVRVAGHVVAFAFSVHLHYQGSPMKIDVIDTFQIDPAGKISAMRAYWDLANMHTLPPHEAA